MSQVTWQTYGVLYKKEWLQGFDCHGYDVRSTTFSWEIEEVPGCICQTSIYVYGMQHNLIHNIKEEKNRGEGELVCKMTEWKRSLKVYILQKREEKRTNNKIEISEVPDFDLTLLPSNPSLVVSVGIEVNQYWALRV